MANYTINFTDPSSDPGNKDSFILAENRRNGPLSPISLATLAPLATGATTSLILQGSSVSAWAEFMQENVLHILENFASGTEPVVATKGQLWYYVNAADVADVDLRIRNPAIGISGSGGNQWESLQVIRTVIPVNPTEGQTWFDNAVPKQLRVYDGTQFVSVAEQYVRLDGVGSMTGSLTLSNAPLDPNHASTKQYVDDIEFALDARLDILETGVGNFLAIDGSNAMTASLDAGNNKIENLSAGTALSDAVNRGQVLLLDAQNAMTGSANISSSFVPSDPVHLTNKSYVDTTITTSISNIAENEVSIRFFESTTNGFDFIALKAPAVLAVSQTYELPILPPDTGYLLNSTSTGTMGWKRIPYDTVFQITGNLGTGVPRTITSIVSTKDYNIKSGVQLHQAYAIIGPTGADAVFEIQLNGVLVDTFTFTVAGGNNQSVSFNTAGSDTAITIGDVITIVLTTADSNDILADISVNLFGELTILP